MLGMLSVMKGRMTRSSVFAMTDRREMGLYEVPAFLSLLGLGMMLARFHICGMVFVFNDRLKSLVMKRYVWGPRFLRWCIFM